jgi:hypothetical protein
MERRAEAGTERSLGELYAAWQQEQKVDEKKSQDQQLAIAGHKVENKGMKLRIIG